MYTNSWKSSLFLGQQKSDMIMCAVASGILSIASWHWLFVGTYYIRRQLGQESPLLPLDLLKIPIFRLSILTSICSFTAQMLAMIKEEE